MNILISTYTKVELFILLYINISLYLHIHIFALLNVQMYNLRLQLYNSKHTYTHL